MSPQASQHETLGLAASLRERWPDHVLKDEYLEARPILELDSSSAEFTIVLPAAALVLLLLVAASANLGTLVLARGVTREREIRVRLALGASRLRVVRQLFTESLLLALLSGVCALLLSTAAVKVMQLQHISTASLVRDWRGLAATFGAAMLAALVFGLPPAFRLASLAPRAGRARPIFLGAQVAVSCLLLGRFESAGQERAAARRQRPRVRLPATGLDCAGPEGPRLWRTCGAGLSRSAA